MHRRTLSGKSEEKCGEISICLSVKPPNHIFILGGLTRVCISFVPWFAALPLDYCLVNTFAEYFDLMFVVGRVTQVDITARDVDRIWWFDLGKNTLNLGPGVGQV